jgi:hypothetical protein
MRDFAHLSDRPAAQQNPQFGKRLDREIYVASEASATPPRSYAPVDRRTGFSRTDLGNFSHGTRVSLPWTHGIEVLSTPDFPVAKDTRIATFRAVRIATKHLISGGFSS